MLSATSTRGPSVLVLRLLEACNAGCFMCDFAFSQDPYRFETTEAAKLADQLATSDVRMVRFTGGEPLLLENLEDLIYLFGGDGRRVSIITNGWHLPERSKMLAARSISQVIVSLDGASAPTHDRFRRLPGLFDRAVEGLLSLKAAHPGVMLRVNTVVGPHNIAQMPQVHGLLVDLKVDQWSIIPLKRSDRTWKQVPDVVFHEHYAAFQAVVDGARRGPRLLGYSRDWAGRTPREIEDFLTRGKAITPSGRCNLVDEVRYYVPQEGVVYPCNCVPHRQDGQLLSEAFGPDALSDGGLTGARDWLRNSGPTACRGCEPVNAMLGDGAIDPRVDPFGF